MGILDGKDVYESKWITAEITDASSGLWHVPIKHTLGDFFLVEINKQSYCFKIDGSRIKTSRRKMAKSFRVLQYDITHYKPIAAPELQKLESLIRESSLPKMDMMQFRVLKHLSRKEKKLIKDKPFEPHQIKHIIDEIGEHQDKFPEHYKNMKQYLESLGTSQIVEPVKNIVEFIEGDLIATEPRFLGSIIEAYQRTDQEHKNITNTPKTAKKGWIKIIAVLMLVVMVGGIGFWAYSSGAFDHIIPTIPTAGTPAQMTDAQLMQKYPTPEAMKAAIDRGELSYGTLDKTMQNMVNSAKLPVATPTPSK